MPRIDEDRRLQRAESQVLYLKQLIEALQEKTHAVEEAHKTEVQIVPVEDS